MYKNFFVLLLLLTLFGCSKKMNVDHIFVNGKIVKSGDKELAQKLDEAGYDQVLDQPKEL